MGCCGHAQTLTIPISLRVGHLVVLLVEAVQIRELRQQLKHTLSVVLQGGNFTAVQVQTPQVL